MTTGVIIHHPTTAPAAIKVWNHLNTILNQKRPGYILWALDQDLSEIVGHALKQPVGGTYKIIPFLIAPGKHFQDDISEVEERLKAERPDLKLERAPVLLENPRFMDFWLSEL
tara:strand:+ start:225 stop:563 length:339 start_codon:yes stop_codon:yes gene_type:complete